MYLPFTKTTPAFAVSHLSVILSPGQHPFSLHSVSSTPCWAGPCPPHPAEALTPDSRPLLHLDGLRTNPVLQDFSSKRRCGGMLLPTDLPPRPMPFSLPQALTLPHLAILPSPCWGPDTPCEATSLWRCLHRSRGTALLQATVMDALVTQS